MDLGIAGRKAVVLASSRGLGKACALALAKEGVEVLINSRNAEALNAASEDIRNQVPGAAVLAVAGSVTDPNCRGAILDAVPEPDILVNNAGGPLAGDFREWTRDIWMDALDTNMLSAIEMVRLTIDGMASRGFGRIVSITSATVRVPNPTLGLSNGIRSGLTNFLFGLVPEFASKGVTINNLLPGPFDTGRFDKSEVSTRHLTKNPIAGRIGEPSELGATCAFVCSKHAAYMTGQNILIDGGKYPGAF